MSDQIEPFCRREFGTGPAFGLAKGQTRGPRGSAKVDVAHRPSRSPKDLARIHPARRVPRWRAPFGGQSIHWINCLSASPSGGLPDAPHRDRAAFLADRLAIGEAEPVPSSHERRWSMIFSENRFPLFGIAL
jgi:hypothetical protein